MILVEIISNNTHSQTLTLIFFFFFFKSPISSEELEVLRHQYFAEGQFVSVQSRFNYAWGLVRSAKKSDQCDGVHMLTLLYRDSPERRREVLYYLSIGSYKLQDYSMARKYADVLLEIEPESKQAIKLRQTIEDRLAKEGFIGFMITSTVVAAAATAVTLFLKNKKR